jgi:predicted RND superfamily exporter protein
MPDCSVNKPFVLLDKIDENDYIKYPMNSNIDSIVADMLKALNEAPVKKYKLVPIDNDVGLVSMPVKSSAEQAVTEAEKALAEAENALAEAKSEAEANKIAAEKALADAEAYRLAIEKELAEAKAKAEAEAKAIAEAEAKAKAEAEAEAKAKAEAEAKAKAEAEAKVTTSMSSAETFENSFMESSTLTWILVIILILLVLYVANSHFKIITLPF